MAMLDKLRALMPGDRNPRAFDAGKSSRRLRSIPTATTEINRLIRSYGANVVARSRYLAANNPWAASAKECFVSALVGSGIKPASLIGDAELKAAIQQLWLDWTDEADADGVTDFYGMQAIVAAEMFEAGECFIRFRPRRLEDGLTVPLQLQLLPSEMLPLEDSRDLPNGGTVECGIEFDRVGRRVAYHFLRKHPGAGGTGEKVRVPAEEILHLFKPIRAGQVRGLPHTLSAMVTLAVLDAYEDAELERKRIAALFAGFVTRKGEDGEDHPLDDLADAADAGMIALEPGAMIDLEPGEDVKFAEPADVGGNYEAFLYRQLLRTAAGFGVPYAAMTGDLRQTSYGSIRAGLVEFRRRIEAMQHHVMVYQFCRPIWRRWFRDAVMAGALPLSPSAYLADERGNSRVKWHPPRWEWIDPLKDRQAEKLAVDSGFKSRSDVIEAEGYDPEETDMRIKQDKDREESLGLSFGTMTSARTGISAPDDDGGE